MSKNMQIPLYAGWLFIASSEKKFDKLYARYIKGKHEEAPAPLQFATGGLTSCAVQKDGRVVVVSGVWPKRHSEACHEAVHCAQFLAEHRGLDPLAEKEAFAYLVQWFFEQLTAKGK